MIRLAWITGYLGDTPNLPGYDLAGESIPQYFLSSSSDDIVLVPDMSRIDSTRQFDGTAGSLSLHHALGLLINDLPRGQAIGLLFGRRYRSYPAALGVMFDRGFATWDDPYGGRTDFSVPRQGCAVFLDRLAELHGFGTGAYVDESIYTAIHELGHVFNLVHNFSVPNFMAGSEENPRSHAFFRFTQADQLHLGLCSIDPEVTPGGSLYRDRDQSLSSVAAKDRLRTPHVSLQIHLARDRVLPFEPVELDIRVHAPARGGKVVIPDEIDPGYPRFRIWIEHPSGERRLYRSPRHYCPSGKTRILGPGESFERDVSIFGQSGGYTFGTPGGYTIWAELQISSRAMMRSNEVEIEVLPPRKEWKHRSILAEPGIARLLYYRRTNPRSVHFRKLRAYRTEHRRDANAGIIDYALGRIHADLAASVKTKSSRTHHARQALSHLSRAADHSLIGRNARRVSHGLVAELRR